MNPSKELMDAAPLTWQTLQQMRTAGLVPAGSDVSHKHHQATHEFEHEALAAHAKEPALLPKVALVAQQGSEEKPRHSRHAFEARHVRHVQNKHSLASLSKVADGSSVSLDEAGYQAVAATHDSRSMWFFIRRVVEANHAEVLDEGMFNGLVPYYSGERDIQNFERLHEELFQNGIQQGMIKKNPRRARSSLLSMDTDFAEVYERTHRLQ